MLPMGLLNSKAGMRPSTSKYLDRCHILIKDTPKVLDVGEERLLTLYRMRTGCYTPQWNRSESTLGHVLAKPNGTFEA